MRNFTTCRRFSKGKMNVSKSAEALLGKRNELSAVRKRFSLFSILTIILLSIASGARAQSTTYSTAGGSYTVTVPAGVTQMTYSVAGAAGGACSSAAGGKGGLVTGTYTVTPGQTLYVFVGGVGTTWSSGTTAGGTSAGGEGGGVGGSGDGGGGGGAASDIRTSVTGGATLNASLLTRIIVGGAGGGGGYSGGYEAGGKGGNPATAGTAYSTYSGGAPGTAIAGGAAGTVYSSYTGSTAGGFGNGGAGGSTSEGGGGGGGWYGGGGATGSGGGGGSSYVVSTASASATFTNGTQAGTGYVTICFKPSASASLSASILSPSMSVTLNGTSTGATSYAWAGPAGGATMTSTTTLSTSILSVNTSNSGVYTLTATNACGSTVATTGVLTVTTTPYMAVSPASVAIGNVNVGSVSATFTFSVSALNLTTPPGNISVSSSNSQYKVSTTGTGGWASSVNVPYSTATLASTPLYVQFTPTVTGASSVALSLSGGSATATETVTATGVNPCVTNPLAPTSMTFTGTSGTGTTVGFTPSGTPDGYLLLVGPTAFTATPTSGTTYSVGATIGTATVVAASYTTSPSYAITGLNNNTTYYYTAIPFFGGASGSCGGGPLYPTGSQLTASVVTCPATPGTPSATAINAASEGLSWTSSAGGGGSAVNYSIIVGTGAGPSSPIAGSPFTVTDPTLTYTVTGLAMGTPYYYNITATGACASAATATGTFTTTPYNPLTISSGLNQDVISEGTTIPSSGTTEQTLGTTGLDGNGYTLVASTFNYLGNVPVTGHSLPANNILATNTVTATTPSGLSWKLAAYNGNNCDFMKMVTGTLTATSTLTFASPVSASNFYVLGLTVINAGSTTVNAKFNYADGTSSAVIPWGTVVNWYSTNSTSAVIAVGRVTQAGVTEGLTTGPNLINNTLANTYTVSPVASISFTATAVAPGTSGNTVSILGVSANSGPLYAGTVATGFSSAIGCSSTSQSFNIYGSQFAPTSGSVTATAPASFQVSSNGTTWGSTATFAYTGGVMANTPVYVRFAPTATGTVSGNVTFSGGGIVMSPFVAVTGTASGGVVIAPATAAAFGPVTIYTASPSIVYTLTGTSLTAGTLNISSSNGDFLVSLNGTTWSTSTSFAYGTSFTATPVYVQYTPSVVASETATITVTGTTLCGPQYISCTGSGSNPCSAPGAPTAMTFTGTSGTGTSVSFTPSGTPDGYLLLRGTSAFTATPTPGTTYTVGATIGTATVVAASYTSSPTYAITGLSSNTTYYYTAIPFYGGSGGTCSGGPLYPTGTQLTAAVTTCPATPGSPAATAINSGSEGLSWTSSAGGGSAINYSIKVATDAGFTAQIPGSPFTVADPTLTYTVTGINAGTPYYYNITAVGSCTSTATATGTFTTNATYTPLTIASGLNQDVISDGVNTTLPISSQSQTTAAYDAQGYGYCAYNYTFTPTSGTSYGPSDGSFPATNIMTSILATTAGLTWKIAPYTGNNCDYMLMTPAAPTTTSTVTFTTPVYASNFYVLASTVIGAGATTVNMQLNYADGTSSAQTPWATIVNWFTSTTNTAVNGEGRIHVTDGSPSGTVGGAPYLIQNSLTNTYSTSPVASISFTATATSLGTSSNVAGVFAVSANSGVLNAGTVSSFSAALGCNSASQSFNINGTQFFPAASGNITATAPACYQVSSNGTTWGATATFPYTAGAMANTPVYVRFTPTVTGTTTGNITFSGGGIVTSPSVAVTGSSSGGVLIAPGSSAAFGPVTVYTASPSIVYTLTGTSLTAGTLTISSSNGDFLVSPDGSTWNTSYSFSYGTSFTATPVYVQYTPSVVASETATVTVSGTTLCAPQYISCTGSGSNPCSAPSVPSAITISSVAATTLTASTTPTGSPDGYLLVAGTSAFSGSPVTATTYSVGASLGGGTVVASAYTTAPSFNVTGLTGNTLYYITSIPFNGGVGGACSGGPTYPSGTQLSTTVTTCPAAPVISTVTATVNSITLNWASASGGGALPVTYSVGVYTNSAFTGPVTGSPFSTSSTSVTVTGLSSGVTYYYKMQSVTSGCSSGYITGSKATGSYCTPSFTNGCSSWYTFSFAFGGASWTGASGTCATSNYLSTVFTVTAGTPTILSVSSAQYTGNAVWVDFANDGTFTDVHDTIFAPGYGGGSALTSPTIYSASVTIPTTVATGSYRMRVITGYGTAPGTSTSGTCGTYSYGDFQDFTLYVVNPILTATTSSLTPFGTIPTCSTSSVQTFSITGTGLYPSTGTVVATAPAGGFQISLNGTTWGNTANYSYTGGSIAAQPVYVQYTSTTVGTFSGNITFSGGTVAAPPTVSVTATAAGIAVTPTTTAFFGPIPVSTTSSALTYTLTGSNLTSGTTTVANSNSDFYVSLNGTTYSNTSVSFSNTGTITGQVLYIQYSPTVVATETSTITVTSPTGCVLTLIATGSGAVSCLAPGTPSGISFPSTTSTGTGITFTPSGSPDVYLVLQGTSAFSGTPTTGTTYAVGNTIGTSTVVGVYTVTTLPLTIASVAGATISPNTGYYITVIPYNGGATGTCTGGPLYATSYLSGTYTTCPGVPTTVASSSVTGFSFVLNWSAPAGGSADAVTYGIDVSTDNTFATGVSSYTTAALTYTVPVTYGSSVYYYRLHAITAACNSGYTATGSVTTGCGNTPLPYNEGFESITSNNTLPSCMSATNLGGANTTWTAATGSYNQTAHTGSKFASFWYANSVSGYCNDWFFTPSFNFVSGTNYQVSFWYVTDGNTGWLSLKAGYGATQSAAGMTTTVGTPLTNVINTTYAQYVGTFTATSTGNNYVGIYCNSNVTPYYLTIDDINVKVLPTLLASPTSVSVGSVNVSGSGVATTSLSGTGLTGSGTVTVTAPARYLVSTTSGSGYASSISVPYTSGSLSSTTIYVQFSPTVTGTVSGTVTCSGGGATLNIPVSGVGVNPSLVVSPSSINMGPTLVGVAAPVQTFSVSGNFLTGYPANITLTSTNTDYQISTDGVTWSSSVTVAYTSGTLTATPISVQYTASSLGASTGYVTLSGGGAITTPTVTLTGSGSPSCSTPTITPTAMVFSGTNATSTTVGFTTPGGVDGYLLVKSTLAFSGTPTSGHNYLVGDALGGGTVIGVYTTAPTYAVTGLTGNTQYFFTVIPFNGGTYGTCGSGPLYDATMLSASMNTCPATPAAPVASAITSAGFNLSWTSSLGGGAASTLNYVVDVSGNTGFTAPITGSPFTVADPTTALSVGTPTAGATYYYRITAVGIGTCSSPATTTGTVTTTTYNYNPITLTGFNEDVIANGSANPANGTLGVAGTSTGANAGFDGANYVFVSSDYTYGSPLVAGQSLPTSGTLSSLITSGLTYQLAGYSTNNALVLSAVTATTATLTLTTPQYASQIYLIGCTGSGSGSCTFTIHYADGTVQTSSALALADWYSGTPIAVANIGRVNETTGAPDGSSTTGPNFYERNVTLTDLNSKVNSIVVTTVAGGTGLLGVVAVTARTGALYASSTAAMSFGTATVCAGSASQNITISGSSLFPASTGIVTATVTPGYQVSTNGTTWGSTATYTVSATSTLASTPVYVRFLPIAGGASTGSLTFVGAGINNAPTISLSGTGVTGAVTGSPTTICQNATTSLSDIVTGGTWSSTNAAVASVSTLGVVTGRSAGTAVISYLYGCAVTANTVSVTVNAIPTTTGVTYNSLCSGTTLSLFSNATGASTYSWSGAAAFTDNTAANPTSATPVTATANGVYSVTMATALGCSVTATSPSVTVSAQPSATVTPSSLNLCTGSVETLTSAVTGGAGTPTYTWSGPGITGTTATGATTTYSLVPSASSGSYSLAISYSVSTGCTTAAATTASVNITPAASITSLTPSSVSLCSGGTLTLTATETGGSGTPTYTWKGPGMSTTTSSSTPLVFTPTVATSASAAYSVTVSFGGTGCAPTSVVTSTTVAVNIQPTVSVSASPLVICNGSNMTLTTASGGGAGTPTYTWSGPGIATAIGSTSGAAVYIPSVSTGAYSVSLSYSGTGCNVVNASSSSVTVNPQPSVAVTASTVGLLCTGMTETITATPSGGSGTAAYTWSGPGISGTAGPFASSVYTVTPAAGVTAGVYSVAVTYSVAGCNTASNTTATVTPTGQQWAGGTSTSWNDPTNWACGIIPTATQDVVIPASTPNAPTLDVSTGYTKKLTITGATLTLGSGNQLDIVGNLVNNGTVTGSGVIYLNGGSAQVLSGNGNVSNMTLANSAGATINSTSDTVGITGTLLLNSGTLTTNGNLMLVSNSGGSGSIGQITGGSISGNVIMQQYVPGGRRAYRFIAHPFNASIPLSQIQNYIDITGTGGSANGFTTTTSNAASAYWYNTSVGNSALGNDPGWTAYTSTNGSGSNAFNKNEGIRLYFRGAKGTGLDGSSYVVAPVTYRTWGAVNTGAQSITLVKGTGANEDYNTIGNPYPAITDIGSVINTASTGGLLTGAAFYIWNPYLGTSGQFVTETIGGSYYLGANESFQVRTATNLNTLSFAESNKGTAVTDALMRTASNDYLTLYIYDNSYHPWDLLHINFNDAATDNEDSRYDGAKAPSPASLNFYSLSADNSQLSLDSRPFNDGKVIPLGIKSSYLQDFIIKAQNVAVPDNGQVYLHDKYLQTYTQLLQGTEYKFTITKDAASQGDNRFELSMKKAGAAIAQAADGLDVQMVPNPATSVVTISYNAAAKAQTTVRVMNVEGITVLTQDLGLQQSGSTQIALDRLASGVYMVEFTSGTQKVVHRLVKE